MVATAVIAAMHGSFNRIHQVVPMCTPFDAWSLRPTRVCILPGMPIGSAVFVHLTRVTNLVTDTPMRHA